MNVPFLNLSAQFATLKDELLPAVETVLSSGRYVLGAEGETFEREIAAHTETRFGVGVNSGTDALLLALRALEIGPGDEVITSAFSFVAPAEAVYQVGARSVLADIDPATFNLDPEDVARKITTRTRALIPVHLFGQPAPMQPLLELAEKHGLQIIEDCAQAIGARYAGKPVGSLGRVGCFSFYPTKNLGAAGDAGMLVTDDDRLARRLRMLRTHGVERRYVHEIHGYNSRLDELQATILRVKLPHLDQWNTRRRQIARRYSEGLAGVAGLQLPATAEGVAHVFHVYAVLTPQRDPLQQFLASRGIPTIIYYPHPIHLQKTCSHLGYAHGDLPAAERVSESVLPLPMYPELTDEQVDYVIGTIREFTA